MKKRGIMSERGTGEQTRPRPVAGKPVRAGGGAQPTDGPSCEEDSRGMPMPAEEAIVYRAMSARCNLLGCDRPDIHHAAEKRRVGCRSLVRAIPRRSSA